MAEKVIRNCNECPGSIVVRHGKDYLLCLELGRFIDELKPDISPPKDCPLYPIEDFLAEIKWAEGK
ncbi:MAG: hypothetical protein J7L26_12645 [Candidatus Aminicenantes bacterium]|nr:hypothetical protein [Candidatus Aminicenantes bacterium]